MTSVVDIFVDTTTLELSAFGSVSGVIALTADEWVYPESAWIDFPLVLLTEWLSAYRDVSTRARGSAVCIFMDGPCSFRLTSTVPDAWHIECLTANGRGVVHEATVLPSQFRSSLERAARRVANACRKRSWKCADLDTIETAFGLRMPPLP